MLDGFFIMLWFSMQDHGFDYRNTARNIPEIISAPYGQGHSFCPGCWSNAAYRERKVW